MRIVVILLLGTLTACSTVETGNCYVMGVDNPPAGWSQCTFED